MSRKESHEIPVCSMCGKHPWFESCKRRKTRKSYTLRLLEKRHPDLLPQEEE